MLTWERHPVYPMITPQLGQRLGRLKFEELLKQRKYKIHQEKVDPLTYGWEPPVWEVGDALLDINLFERGSGPWEEKRDLNRRYRDALGFLEPVTALLINGGNRLGKTEFAAKRMMQTLLHRAGVMGWMFHSSQKMSRMDDSHQPLCWKYMPKNIRELHGDNGIKTNKAYIRFFQKNGFSDDSFILPNGSSGEFKYYGQDQDKAIQGGNPYAVWMDELFQLAWFKDCFYRVASKEGWLLGTFTPKNGYSPTCAWFYEKADIMRESVAFMLPTDGGEPDLQRALGFETAEQMQSALEKGEDRYGKKGYGPNSIPENCRNWIEGKPSQPAVPEGRAFEKVPRVMRCAPVYFDGKWKHNRAVLFMHSCDGPYGTPRSVIEAAATQSKEEIKWRVYGFTKKLKGALLKRFANHHLCEMSEIPEEGTNFLIVDPAPGRNTYMLWLRFCGLDVYAYREWPGNYEIPGIGFPGEWVEPDEKHLDGKRGPGQESFGWGARDLKKEIARLEGWEEYQEDGDATDWSEWNGSREKIAERLMDSRSASNPRIDHDRITTLLTTFDDLGMCFQSTPADDNAAKVTIINDWLDWEPGDNMSLDRMRLHIGRDLVNLIGCMHIWTGEEGQKGASKDPIDCIGYGALAKLEDLGKADYETETEDYG